MPWQGNGWTPSTITRYIGSFKTSTGVAVVDTDCGEGYLKALGNPEGPHVLACELVGSCLADWLGLPTLDFTLIEVTSDDEIPLGSGELAQPGPAFISRKVAGFSWGGNTEALLGSANPEDTSRLVAFDTWVLNCDRYRPDPVRRNPDNVFFVQPSEAGARPRLIAMDHSHTFTCGRELTRRIANVDRIQSSMVYGKFPEFMAVLNLAAEAEVLGRLREMNTAQAQEFVRRVPAAWEIDADVRAAWVEFIYRRALFVSNQGLSPPAG